MVYPFFYNGSLSILNRPENKVLLDYSDILDKKPIEIYLSEENRPSHALEGMVVEEDGDPLEAVRVFPLISTQMDQNDNYCLTDGNGHFTLYTDNNPYDQLSFSPHFYKGLIYSSDNIFISNSEEFIKISMKAWTGVRVNVGAILKALDQEIKKNNTWIENKNGTTYFAEKTIIKNRNLYFLGLPYEEQRITIMNEAGERFHTPYFNLIKGKSLYLRIDSDTQ